ncbi:unnamed protein product, partial [Closterium sp. NIES-53]
AEFDACLEEFRADYNQTHFVRSPDFKEAADKIQGRAREIFVEFLERSCTAEFSGFLLYKELGRRLKKTNPCIAEIFTLMSRDEARHAGFLNKALSCRPFYARHLVRLHESIIAVDANQGAPELLRRVQKLPLQAAFVGELLAMYLMRPVDAGSVEFDQEEARIVY